MYVTADFLNRTVLSLSDGKNRGNVVNFEFDGRIKNLTHLVVDGFLLPVAKIFKSSDAIVVIDEGDFAPLDKTPLNPEGLSVYGTSGTLTDKIKQVRFDGKFRVKEIEGEHRTYLPKEIISASSDAVIIKDCPLPRKHSANPKPRKTVAEEGSKVIMPDTSVADFSFLLGRRVDKTVFDRQHEVIVKTNAVITQETLRKARIHGKLLELALHAVK